MSETNPFVEPLLRFPRVVSTVSALRRFEAQGAAEEVTSGGEFYRMRSAMDLHPAIGKWVSRVGVRHPQGGIPAPSDIAQSHFVDADEIGACLEALKKDGFYVFEKLAPSDIVDRIRAHAEGAICHPRGTDEPLGPYPRRSPVAGRYDIYEDQMLLSDDVQDFCSDPGMAGVSSAYLGQPVIQDLVSLWWTTPQRAQDADLNAQLFHQDRDRLSWLKFFMYLTDVGEDTGPHMYIRGTHRHTPWSLRSDGRKTDDAVRNAGIWDRVAELTGPAGSLMAVDTVGLHKGKTPERADRLVIQVEFSTSLFGAPVEVTEFTPSDLTRERLSTMPEILQRWRRSLSG